MIRSLSESQEHQDLIRMMVRHFQSDGCTAIKADVPEMKTPDLIYGTRMNHIPDMTAEKNGGVIILEAETSSSISDGHTASQWSLFSDAAKKAAGAFHVVVPKESRNAAEQRAASLGIQVDVVWTPS